MKSVTVKFYFRDDDYEKLDELAKKLNISKQELINQFFSEGMSFMWEAFEYEAEKNKNKNSSI